MGNRGRLNRRLVRRIGRATRRGIASLDVDIDVFSGIIIDDKMYSKRSVLIDFD